MSVNPVDLELLKECGYLYLVARKNNNHVITSHEKLYDAVLDLFGFSMSNVSVGIYDIELDRYLEPKEYDEEMKKVIENQKKIGCMLQCKVDCMEILMWFCIGALIGLTILFWIFVMLCTFYTIFKIAFALFDALGIENPFLVIYEWIRKSFKQPFYPPKKPKQTLKNEKR